MIGSLVLLISPDLLKQSTCVCAFVAGSRIVTYLLRPGSSVRKSDRQFDDDCTKQRLSYCNCAVLMFRTRRHVAPGALHKLCVTTRLGRPVAIALLKFYTVEMFRLSELYSFAFGTFTRTTGINFVYEGHRVKVHVTGAKKSAYVDPYSRNV